MSHSYITTVIYRPGTVLRAADDSPTIWGPNDTDLSDALGGKVYSVTRAKMVVDGDELIVDGKLAETLFIVTSVIELRPGTDPSDWLTECLIEGCLEESNMAALYEVAKSHLEPPAPPEVIDPVDDFAKMMDATPHLSCPTDHFDIVSFLGHWTAHTSYDWESGFTELDYIEFAGESKVVPL